MPARVRLALMAVATLVLLGAVGIIVLVRPGDAPAPQGYAGALRPAIPPADFTLRDQEGRTATLRSYRGRVVILTFLYSTCRDTCPVMASQIRGALDRLGSDVPALAVSVDPTADTQRSARAFLARRGLTGRMRFLLGSRHALEPVWRAYGVRPQGHGFEHSAYVLLVDRRGRQRIGFPFDRLTPEGLAHDVRRLSAER